MAIEESQSQVASPIRLGPAVCEKDAKALQFIDEMTMNTDAVQEWVLEEILSQNAETEYLRPYQLDGATDRDTFKSKTPNETWDCIVCGKHFCKKKSLGGHMNRHPERPWRGLYPPPTGHHAPEACVVCGKRFVSKKALGGHMKHHPQRSWRVLLPPTGEPAAARNGNTTVPLQIDLNQPAPSQIDLNQPAPSQIDLNQPAPEE